MSPHTALLAWVSLLAACAPSLASAPPAASVTLAPATSSQAPAVPWRETPDAPFRSAAPPLLPAAPFTAPPIQSLRLSNGVRVFFLERHVPALLRVELVVKTRGAPLGAATMAAHDLWLGTSRHTQAQIASALDGDLAQGWAWAEWGIMGAGLLGLSDRAGSMIALLAEVTLTPTFPADLVLRMHLDEVRGRQAVDDVPETVAARVLPMALYRLDRPEDEGSSLRAPDIDALQREDVVHAYDAAFDPSRATLLVTGDTTAEALRPMLERAFGSWTHRPGHALAKPPVAPRSTASPPPGVASPRLVVVDRPHSPESFVLFGGPGPSFSSSDWAPAAVMNAIFGGPIGRATRALTDERHLVWRTFSRLVARPSTPRLVWSGELATQRTAEGLREVDRQMRSMRDADVSSTELEEERDRLVRLAPGWLTTPEGERDALRGLVIQDLAPDHLSKAAADLSAVTTADVRRVAASYLDPDRMKIVVVGDWTELRAQLLELGWGAVELRNASGAVVSVEPAKGP